jgi:hypothetical protein
MTCRPQIKFLRVAMHPWSRTKLPSIASTLQCGPQSSQVGAFPYRCGSTSLRISLAAYYLRHLELSRVIIGVELIALWASFR